MFTILMLHLGEELMVFVTSLFMEPFLIVSSGLQSVEETLLYKYFTERHRRRAVSSLWLKKKKKKGVENYNNHNALGCKDKYWAVLDF